MKEEMIKSLKLRFAGVEKKLSIATILDPRFKDKFFASSIIKVTVKEMLNEEIQKIAPGEDDDMTQGQTSSTTVGSPVPKRAKKDMLLTMYHEIIEKIFPIQLIKLSVF